MRYYFLQFKNKGIIRIQGSTFYADMSTLEGVNDVRLFNSKKEAINYAKINSIEYDSIGKLSWKVKTVL